MLSSVPNRAGMKPPGTPQRRPPKFRSYEATVINRYGHLGPVVTAVRGALYDADVRVIGSHFCGAR
jgi:hypothetical protein